MSYNLTLHYLASISNTGPLSSTLGVYSFANYESECGCEIWRVFAHEVHQQWHTIASVYGIHSAPFSHAISWNHKSVKQVPLHSVCDQCGRDEVKSSLLFAALWGLATGGQLLLFSPPLKGRRISS